MIWHVDERTSGIYTATLVAEDEVTPVGALLTLTLTLYDVATGTIINGRNAQDVLGAGTGANQVTYSASTGALQWAFRPEDMAIVGTAQGEERHIALFLATWSAGTKAKPWEVPIYVRNLGKLPT